MKTVGFRWLLLAFGGPLLATGCATNEKPAGYESAAREVRLNRNVPSHDLYHSTIERRLRPPLERAARRCSVRIPDTRATRILHRLDASGSPVETMIYPDAGFGRCVYEEIRDIAILPPPEPDYWIAIEIPIF